MSFKNYYILLDVNNNASFEDIKIAYRDFAKKFHPDKNQGNKLAEESFKEIQEAYAVLSNPEKRKKYDLHFSYVNNYRQQNFRRTPTYHPTYTGNAYQYAQQQAQQKQHYKTTKKQEQQPDKSENYYLLISICVAFILLYFIISYSK